MKNYYEERLRNLNRLFGSSNIHLAEGQLTVDEHLYPIIDDVIILLEPSQYPQSIKERLSLNTLNPGVTASDFAEDIQFTYGKQWEKFPKILPEYKREFEEYFDIVDINDLKNKRVCDLGCGTGRWVYFLKDICKEIVLVDFSEAIFVARYNLKDAKNVLFFMGDLRRLPFKNDFCDFLYCLGVLHHLPVDAIEEVRYLKKYSKKLLIYLYYSFDNKPAYFNAILTIITPVRLILSKIRNQTFRHCFSWFGVVVLYMPLIWLGNILNFFNLSKYIPLYDGHYWNSLEELRHHVYDRFFTSIEQRVSRDQIKKLEDTFTQVTISKNPGYWHFLCVSDESNR